MEAIISSLLGNYFSLFFKNFDIKKDATFRLGKGEATLGLVYLNEEVVRELIGFETLDIERLHIVGCKINISPTKLASTPTLVDIETLSMTLFELERPKPLPTRWSDFIKQQKAKVEVYGLKDKIADGIRLRIQKVNIVLRLLPVNDANFKMRQPPLIVLSIRNLVVEQTDDEWQVVDLNSARKFSTNKDFVYVFRKISLNLHLHLVPYSGPSDPSSAFLRGATIENFDTHKHVNTNQTFFNAVSLFDGISLSVLNVIKKRTKDGAVVHTGIEIIMNDSYTLELDPRALGLIFLLVKAMQRIVLKSPLSSVSAASPSNYLPSPLHSASSTESANNDNAKSHQVKKKLSKMRNIVRRTRLASEKSTIFETTKRVSNLSSVDSNPSVCMNLRSSKLALKLHNAGVKEFSHDYLLFNFVKVFGSFFYDPINGTNQREMLITRFEIGGMSADFVDPMRNLVRKVIAVSTSSEPISDLCGPVPTLLGLEQGGQPQNGSLDHLSLRLCYSQISPCPAPPEYGKNLEFRLRRLVFHVHESVLNFLYSFRNLAEFKENAPKKQSTNTDPTKNEIPNVKGSVPILPATLVETSDGAPPVPKRPASIPVLLAHGNLNTSTVIASSTISADTPKFTSGSLSSPNSSSGSSQNIGLASSPSSPPNLLNHLSAEKHTLPKPPTHTAMSNNFDVDQSPLSTLSSSAPLLNLSVVSNNSISNIENNVPVGRMSTSSRSSSTAIPLTPAATADIFGSFACNVEINGPTIYFYPAHFSAPLLTIDFSNTIIVGNRELPLPTFALRSFGSAGNAEIDEESISFPDNADDFVHGKILVGDGKAATKLLLLSRPFSIILFNGEDIEERAMKSSSTTPPNDKSTVKEESNESTTNVQFDRHRMSSSTTTPQELTPIVEEAQPDHVGWVHHKMSTESKRAPGCSALDVGQFQLGFNWDYTANPSVMISMTSTSVHLNVSRESVHMLYLLSDEYENKPPSIWRTLGEKLVAPSSSSVSPSPTNNPTATNSFLLNLLLWIPNPHEDYYFVDEDGEEYSSRDIDFHDRLNDGVDDLTVSLFTRLPTYVLATRIDSLNIAFIQTKLIDGATSNTEEQNVFLLKVQNLSIMAEHQERKLDMLASEPMHVMSVKIILMDLSINSHIKGDVLSRIDLHQPVFASRFEDNLGTRSKKRNLTSFVNIVSILMQHWNSSSDVTSTALAMLPSTLAGTSLSADLAPPSRILRLLLLLRDLVDQGQIFNKNGIIIQFGLLKIDFDAQVFASMAAFFLADISGSTRKRYLLFVDPSFTMGVKLTHGSATNMLQTIFSSSSSSLASSVTNAKNVERLSTTTTTSSSSNSSMSSVTVGRVSTLSSHTERRMSTASTHHQNTFVSQNQYQSPRSPDLHDDFVIVHEPLGSVYPLDDDAMMRKQFLDEGEEKLDRIIRDLGVVDNLTSAICDVDDALQDLERESFVYQPEPSLTPTGRSPPRLTLRTQLDLAGNEHLQAKMRLLKNRIDDMKRYQNTLRGIISSQISPT